MDDQKPMTEEELMMFAQAQEQQQVDPRLQAAREQRDKMQMYGGLLSGFQDLIKGATGYNPNYGTAEAIKQQGNQAVKDYQLDKASEAAASKAKMEQDKNQLLMDKYSQELDKGKYDLSDQEKTRDPNSMESKIAQKFLLDLKPDLDPKSVEQLSAHQIYITNKPMQDFLVQKMKTDAEKYRLEQQDKRIAQADERLNIQREKETGKQKRFDRSQSFKEEEKQEISDKQTEEITQYDMGNDVLDRIEEQMAASEQFLGPYSSRIEDKSSLIPGVEKDPQFVKMQALVGDQLAKYVKTLSGTAVSDEERARLEKNIPMMTDKPGEFKTKLATFRKTLNDAKKRTIGNIEKQGKNPSKFKDGKQSSGVKKRVIQNGNIFEVDETGNAKFIGKAQ